MTKKSLALLAALGLIWPGLCGCAAMFITREAKIFEERANDLHEDLLDADLALSEKARDAFLKAGQDLAEARDNLDDLIEAIDEGGHTDEAAVAKVEAIRLALYAHAFTLNDSVLNEVLADEYADEAAAAKAKADFWEAINEGQDEALAEVLDEALAEAHAADAAFDKYEAAADAAFNALVTAIRNASYLAEVHAATNSFVAAASSASDREGRAILVAIARPYEKARTALRKATASCEKATASYEKAIAVVRKALAANVPRQRGADP